MQAEWYYQPCTRLGGDAFGYQMLDTRCFAAYMLDVAGHGAGAALFAVTVANVLRQRMLPDVDFRDPGAVIRGLNRMFPMERHNNLFFTMWYGVYDVAERVVSYATAGHHPAYLLAAGATQPMPLGTRNPSIGIGADRDVAAARAPVAPGSSLFLFSDGVFEITDHEGREWDLSQVLSLLPVDGRTQAGRAACMTRCAWRRGRDRWRTISPRWRSVSFEDIDMADLPIRLTCADYARVMPLAVGDGEAGRHRR